MMQTDLLSLLPPQAPPSAPVRARADAHGRWTCPDHGRPVTRYPGACCHRYCSGCGGMLIRLRYVTASGERHTGITCPHRHRPGCGGTGHVASVTALTYLDGTPYVGPIVVEDRMTGTRTTIVVGGAA